MMLFDGPKRPEAIEIVVSTIKSLSSMSLFSRRAILTVLKTKYRNVGITVVNNQYDLDKVLLRKPDLVFLGMKFVPTNHTLGITDPNKIWLTECLDIAGISYTGSSKEANELEFNKQQAKQCITQHGLNTAQYLVVKRGYNLTEEEITLRYPLFVKPLDRGGGAGINNDSLVRNFSQLKSRIAVLDSELKADALIEEYLPGREFSVGILKNVFTDDYTAMPLEIITPSNQLGDRFLSSAIKIANKESTQAINDPLLALKLNTLALKAFHALGATDYGRIDIRLDAHGEPHFLEANLLPSLIENYGNFPKTCLLNLGLSHKDLLFQLVDLGLASNSDATALNISEHPLLPLAL
jgi:D-alanine-D-alanine ligase